MATEIAVEKALTEGFASNGIAHLEEPVTAFLNGYNLASERIRDLYCALTGDLIHNQPWWSDFTTSAKRRNNIIHAGAHATAADAEASLKVADQLLAHLKI
jgi:hypothetical protein